MNQIGGVGAVGAGNGSRTFNSTADGVKDVPGKHVFETDGTCRPCSKDKCCYELEISADVAKTIQLLYVNCGANDELIVNEQIIPNKPGSLKNVKIFFFFYNYPLKGLMILVLELLII